MTNVCKHHMVSTEVLTSPTPEEHSKHIQTKGEPFCTHHSSQTLQRGCRTAEVGTQVNARQPLTLLPPTRSVGTQDNPRYNVVSVPIGTGTTQVPVITLLSNQCHTYCLITQGTAYPLSAGQGPVTSILLQPLTKSINAYFNDVQHMFYYAQGAVDIRTLECRSRSILHAHFADVHLVSQAFTKRKGWCIISAKTSLSTGTDVGRKVLGTLCTGSGHTGCLPSHPSYQAPQMRYVYASKRLWWLVAPTYLMSWLETNK